MAYGKDLTLQMSLLSGTDHLCYFPLLFGKCTKSSFWKNAASLGQVSLQCSFKSHIWKHVWVVTLLFGICESLLHFSEGELHLQYATFCFETERLL